MSRNLSTKEITERNFDDIKLSSISTLLSAYYFKCYNIILSIVFII